MPRPSKFDLMRKGRLRQQLAATWRIQAQCHAMLSDIQKLHRDALRELHATAAYVSVGLMAATPSKAVR